MLQSLVGLLDRVCLTAGFDSTTELQNENNNPQVVDSSSRAFQEEVTSHITSSPPLN